MDGPRKYYAYEISQTEKDKYCMFSHTDHLYLDYRKLKQMNVHNKTKKDSQIWKISGYQWEEGRRGRARQGYGIKRYTLLCIK